MKILAIETSCDETAASVVEVNRGNFNVLSNVVSSQEKVHAKYGGIVPEVAARLHVEKILPIVDLAIKKAKVTWPKIDYIAVTAGPGLISSLMVGVETAKTLAYAHNKPLVKVNHIEGHLLSILGARKKESKKEKKQHSRQLNKPNQLKFPAVGLVVSGGHTQIILVEDYLKYKLIGETRDDAAGEAFDKVAKILGLGYPGGPAISAMAEKGQGAKVKEQGIKLPRPMLDSPNFDMSFSGLKTAVLYAWRDLKDKSANSRAEVAKEFQDAVVEVLVTKTLKAAKKYNAKMVILGGGVSANSALRETLSYAATKQNLSLLIPELKLTGDNAVMIGMAAYYHIQNKDFVEPFNLRADPQWELV
ncbi:tRNA (adenosine(37)-N6)-threonylcarbamoyltransferase complex transferase subunit TsaD [Candidatus Falkowbacteria bacterium]|jgi:N6-L-threonylcarbamoyladenine synthase|nr:tRNA (adenosine(37)-N6)-threonylcarbamoyltransferase complex transferase subunit TsaD [Candidatus Falkowbacteria bacterium]MBT5503093.1 tRNA (adenosine(37)-N6)-threonylcarbamoyltransferase complex transferase subunit TsaD [Candidatus Falkowbacteria bacterium]MBT6574187.1 tRNA (adenosine(37)-N6)-threonylcarbamoyltransferase complex transferase subunit TsaD [Candidatus Falkowbacteria bacterium]MBT7348666.1 tRNA (adenosine(37)-N6)-threonylcarbamoyltransferase complex transferase subunit TsaD [Ca